MTENMNNEALNKLKIRYDRRKRRFSEIGSLSIAEHQFYAPRELRAITDITPERKRLVNKTTRVASMGSCFAREVGTYLVNNDFNYMQEGEGVGAGHGSARWERVYNTPCIRQEMERILGSFEGQLLEGGGGRVIDPYRKGIKYDDLTTATADVNAYVGEANRVLATADLFILTLGMSETWRNSKTGNTYAEFLPTGFHDPALDEFHLVTPDENTENLLVALKLVKAHNPGIEIILTVSPIPMRLTYLPRSAYTSNAVSKASLVWAASEVTSQLDFVHYFPSYEIVTTCIDIPFDWDNRHVTPSTIATVMDNFEYSFCDNQ